MKDVRQFVGKGGGDLTWIGPRQLEIRLIIHGKGIGSDGIEFEGTSTSFQHGVRRLVGEGFIR